LGACESIIFSRNPATRICGGRHRGCARHSPSGTPLALPGRSVARVRRPRNQAARGWDACGPPRRDRTRRQGAVDGPPGIPRSGARSSRRPQQAAGHRDHRRSSKRLQGGQALDDSGVSVAPRPRAQTPDVGGCGVAGQADVSAASSLAGGRAAEGRCAATRRRLGVGVTVVGRAGATPDGSCAGWSPARIRGRLRRRASGLSIHTNDDREPASTAWYDPLEMSG
jgi:hypothetical protein